MTRRLAIKNHSPSSNAFVCFLSTRDVDITRTFDGNHKCVINTCLFVGKSKRRFDIFYFRVRAALFIRSYLSYFCEHDWKTNRSLPSCAYRSHKRFWWNFVNEMWTKYIPIELAKQSPCNIDDKKILTFWIWANGQTFPNRNLKQCQS